MERAIKIAKLCPYVDRVVVTTDDPEMYEIAKRYGVATPDLRPKFLATDEAKTVDVVLHLLESLPIKTGWIVLLQVTTPLRTLDDFTAFCRTFESGPDDSEAAVSLVKFDSPHPDKIQKIDNGWVRSYLGKNSSVARQSLPTVYALNGAFYLTHRDVVVEQRTFLPPRTLPFVMPEDHSVNLDTMTDIYVLEALVQRGIYKIEEYEL